MSTKYDDSLSDDACHPSVLRAREAGRAWAEREWDALIEEAMREQSRADQWYPTAVDAKPLVGEIDDDDLDDELADICNAAAAERWSALCADFRERNK